jgi:hypothetical protein
MMAFIARVNKHKVKISKQDICERNYIRSWRMEPGEHCDI